jgi:ribosomal protein L11
MSNKASQFANNLSVTANIANLTIESLQQISRNENIELNAASRDAIVKRILLRIGNQLRVKDVVK